MSRLVVACIAVVSSGCLSFPAVDLDKAGLGLVVLVVLGAQTLIADGSSTSPLTVEVRDSSGALRGDFSGVATATAAIGKLTPESLPIFQGLGYGAYQAGLVAGIDVITIRLPGGEIGHAQIQVNPRPPSPSPQPQPSAPPLSPPSPSPVPSYAPAQASPTPATGDPCGVAELPQDTPTVGYDELDFEWEYASSVWSWTGFLPSEWYDYYGSRERPSNPQDYAVLAADPLDDPLLDQVACMMRETASSEGFGEFETVEFALSFVQGLDYVQDRVGVGFDDYPKFPVETLVDHGGDCEDSSILFAAIVGALGYDAVLLLFENIPGKNVGHMAVGTYSSDIPGTYYRVDGRDYYYVETTHSGWRIGDVPDQFESLSAKILRLLPRALLAPLEWTSAADGLRVRFDLRVKNVGVADAHSLVVWGGWDAGGAKAWSPITWSEGTALPPNGYVDVTLWLPPPPSGAHTRAWFRAWGADAVMVESFSNWFTA